MLGRLTTSAGDPFKDSRAVSDECLLGGAKGALAEAAPEFRFPAASAVLETRPVLLGRCSDRGNVPPEAPLLALPAVLGLCEAPPILALVFSPVEPLRLALPSNELPARLARELIADFRDPWIRLGRELVDAVSKSSSPCWEARWYLIFC